MTYYLRLDQGGPKESYVTLFSIQPHSPLKKILTDSLGVLAVVEKKREIYFIDSVKIHLDSVNTLGTFVEIEAIETDESTGRDLLMCQCRDFIESFGISEFDLIETSYRDLVTKPGPAS